MYSGVDLALAAMIGAMVGLVLAYLLGAGGSAGEAERLRERERSEADRVIERLRQALEGQEQRARDNLELQQLLPDLVREMFTVSGRRGVAPLALKLVDRLFHPTEAAIFMARSADRRLALGAGLGLPPELPTGFEVEYGEGRIGYVAETRRTMTAADFDAASSVVRRHLEATAVQGLRADVVAPIKDRAGLLGVVSIGGARNRTGQEKDLLRMVADLTALALNFVTRLRETEEAVHLDGLTGVFDKQHFQRRMTDELRRAASEQQPASLLILDIDYFRIYNDTNGQAAGDEVLKKLGQVLKGSTREDDVAARYGGEEFVVLYPGASKADALRLAEGLRRAVESSTFPYGARQPLGAVTISGGVATFPEDSPTGVDLVRCADAALFEAKAGGRNRIVGARREQAS